MISTTLLLTMCFYTHGWILTAHILGHITSSAYVSLWLEEIMRVQARFISGIPTIQRFSEYKTTGLSRDVLL